MEGVKRGQTGLRVVEVCGPYLQPDWPRPNLGQLISSLRNKISADVDQFCCYTHTHTRVVNIEAVSPRTDLVQTLIHPVLTASV